MKTNAKGKPYKYRARMNPFSFDMGPTARAALIKEFERVSPDGEPEGNDWLFDKPIKPFDQGYLRGFMAAILRLYVED